MDESKESNDEVDLERLLLNIRSEVEAERNTTIGQIPTLIFQSLKERNYLLDQLLLVIYHLHTAESDNFEFINETNRTLVFRHLLRLYSDAIHEHHHEQVDALTKIVNFVHSSELLVELAYVLNKCCSKLILEEDKSLVEDSLSFIQEKAAANLYSEALLMIHSIIATK